MSSTSSSASAPESVAGSPANRAPSPEQQSPTTKDDTKEVDKQEQSTEAGHDSQNYSPAEKAASTSPSAAPAESDHPGPSDPSQEPADESPRSSPEPGLIDETEEGEADTGSAAPPLPAEPLPGQQQEGPADDGWDPHWIPADQSWWFYNRYTGVWQKENPRIPEASTAALTTAAPTPAVVAAPPPPTTGSSAISDPTSVAGGYNPAIHGNYDPNAWYAKKAEATTTTTTVTVASQAILGSVDPAAAEAYETAGYFNRATGQWQVPETQGPERHSDDAKSRRQMGAYFDVDAAANMHDGRSLKAERAGKKPTRSELKAFKEKRKAKKEEKRRAWLRD